MEAKKNFATDFVADNLIMLDKRSDSSNSFPATIPTDTEHIEDFSADEPPPPGEDEPTGRLPF